VSSSNGKFISCDVATFKSKYCIVIIIVTVFRKIQIKKKDLKKILIGRIIILQSKLKNAFEGFIFLYFLCKFLRRPNKKPAKN
jgi:hypothetical protein